MAVLADVFTYWFGSAENDLQVIKSHSKLWFGKDRRVDREIKHKFAVLVEQAGKEKIAASGLRVPLANLAQIILLDQFTRNIYRDMPQAFACDSVALGLALAGLDSGEDQFLRPVERVFYYLPLEHSEELQHQNRSVELFRNLHAAVPDDWQAAFAGFLDYAIRHQVIIERFGRFPHRNTILGRESTAEEREFLLQPNSSF